MSDEQIHTTAPHGERAAATSTSSIAGGYPEAPAAGEDIHLPPGTPIPILIAFGLTLTLVGTTINWLWTILGGIVFITCLVLWIRDTRHEVAHLPDELGSPTHH